MKILKLLNKRSKSAGDLADELEMRLNTLKYNLDSLLEVGLIRVNQVKWSHKGIEIKIYEIVEKVIILLPEKRTQKFLLIRVIRSQKRLLQIRKACCEN